jgi:K+-transporting ATPase ATPase C chain
MNTLVRPAVALFLVLTVITGVIYPGVITGISHVLFSRQAEGSLIFKGDQPIGSALIGQSFTGPQYFWSRLSATSPQPYNGLASGGSNSGPLNPALTDAVKTRVAALRAADPGNTAPVPADLVTASASGLDPDISVAAANYQVVRVARTRHLGTEAVRSLVAAHTRGTVLGIFGEPRVNVLELNLALDIVAVPASPK